ncbi:hypothetical protein RHOFW510R12_00685 [Rhodanobacter sp. FW510-R12]|uniref:AAA-like domain-containing protein n=1 Tax=Rhodanobacter thiooxydans TaxID=416169 RepID=UPI0009215D3E|nr:AAA-like domain-containing protein [Rhodanobacter thiooxydans]UJJ56757.1 AAA-like domain-containing protein [Rhodanobacter thiooxydans]
MSPISLPYFPRTGLLEDVARVYQSGLKQGITLFAPRRQGKTSFVKHELLPYARETLGWQVIYIDLWARRDAPDLALVEGLEAELERRNSGWRRKLKLAKVKARAKAPGADVEATMVPVGYEADDTLEGRLARALAAVVNGRPTLLVLDEVQALVGVQRDNFVSAFRTALLAQTGMLFAFYTGSSREGLNRLFRVQKAPLFESAMPLQLPPLGPDFVEDRIEFLSERTAKRVDRTAMLEAFDALGRTPEYLNELVLQLIIANDADVPKALAAWRAAREEAGAYIGLDGLRDLDRAVLALLAQPKHPSIYSADGVEFMSRYLGGREVKTSSVQGSVRKLAKRAMVAPTGRHGDYEIEDPVLLLQLREDAKTRD